MNFEITHLELSNIIYKNHYYNHGDKTVKATIKVSNNYLCGGEDDISKYNEMNSILMEIENKISDHSELTNKIFSLDSNINMLKKYIKTLIPRIPLNEQKEEMNKCPIDIKILVKESIHPSLILVDL